MPSPVADYPAPTIIAQTTGTGLQTTILDASPFIMEGYPPVVQINISNTATVVIYGSCQVSGTNPATLIDGIIVSGAGVTASGFYDLVVGIPFYAFDITANTGTVTIRAGRAPSGPRNISTPSPVRMTTNATQGL